MNSFCKVSDAPKHNKSSVYKRKYVKGKTLMIVIKAIIYYTPTIYQESFLSSLHILLHLIISMTS